jgi:hypothetical protein
MLLLNGENVKCIKISQCRSSQKEAGIQSKTCCLFLTGYLLDLHLNPEDGGGMFF